MAAIGQKVRTQFAMSQRMTKTVKVNGVIVGEYLGSDDYFEDVAAAREFLRQKGVWKAPSLPQTIYGQASAFAYVANETYKELMRREPDRPIVAAPFIVNAAFCVELFLKSLHAVNGQTRRGHKLVPLFDALPEARRAELGADAQRFAPAHGEVAGSVDFRALLTMLNDTFRKWRYVYEETHAGPIHLQQTILVMETCHEVCKRTVFPSPGKPTS
jgi:hypothetical protein